jgi:hypothetical protein
MNDLRRIELWDPSTKSRSSSAQRGQKVVICLLAALIVLVMIAWLGLLGWGAVATLQSLLSYINALR